MVIQIPNNTIIVASGSKSKREYYEKALKTYAGELGIPKEVSEGLTVLSMKNLVGHYDSPSEEPATNYKEAALIKARTAAKRLQAAKIAHSGLIICDDSGMEIEAFDNKPGIRSSRYLEEGILDDNNEPLIGLEKLMYELNKTATFATNKKCKFITDLILLDPSKTKKENFMEDAEDIVAYEKQTISGRISETIRDEDRKRFGYQPVLIPDDYNQTVATMDPVDRIKVMPRGLAIMALAKKLKLT